ncbi:cutinase family protein [Mycolicibacterium baixiangningiae]|uniref:cutinase family protein n=1 Tax=Mycolicibacterium baixiangningiae TaxID=2761578 RepID=UPI0018D18549|nr:cutinase family protein [Mycolicibacterium baixiangningiae]
MKISRAWRRVLAATAVGSGVLAGGVPALPVAVAEPCPDVEVIFARGTTEAPGVGWVGQAFVDALQNQLGGRSVQVHPVAYPASPDWPRAADGVIDTSNRVRQVVDTCPDSKMVLGGYSQGAAVMGYVTADEIPPGYIPPAGITGPMAPEIADHVSAVVLFGQPSTRFLDAISAPPITIGTLYADKTLNQCIPDDPICTDTGGNLFAHSQYGANGMILQAAAYAAQRLTA